MFDIGTWFCLGFRFEFDGNYYVKRKDSDHYDIDGCEHQVFEDDQDSLVIPKLLMALYNANLIEMKG